MGSQAPSWTCSGIADACLTTVSRPARLRGEANPVRRGPPRCQTGGLEVRSIPQEGVEHSTEPVSDRYDGGLVPTSSTEFEKVRMERMRQAPRVMGQPRRALCGARPTPLADGHGDRAF